MGIMANLEKYKYRKSVVLTPEEGAKLEEILKDKKCKNVSQLLKLIVKDYQESENSEIKKNVVKTI